MQVEDIPGRVGDLGSAELVGAPVGKLLLLRDVDSEQVANEILEAMLIRVGAREARCDFGAVDRCRHDTESIAKNQTAPTEKGEPISGRGDAVNMHDILTGSDPQGMYSTAGGDTTCGNWTKSGEGSAIVGHHDRAGLKDTRHMNSWNSSHGSRGCSQDQLKASGGAGLIYCFVAN